MLLFSDNKVKFKTRQEGSFEFMRRTPYTDRLARADVKQNKQPIELLGFQNKKQEIARLSNSSGSYFPSKNMSRGYQIQSKFNKQHFQRPFTVTRAYSELKNRSQDKQHSLTKIDRFQKKDRSLKKTRYDKDELNQSKTQRELQINTAKDQLLNNNNSRVRDENSSKGKLFRGSSWKNEDRSKLSAKESSREASRYSHNSRLMQNLTTTTKDQRVGIKKTMRNNEISDLLNKNMKEKERNSSAHKQRIEKEQNFFQYVMRFSYRTKKGYIPSNPDKVNQDSYVLSPNINKRTWQHFFAVCDGHGPLGHHVSSFLKTNLPNSVIQCRNLEKKPIESLMKIFETTYQKMIKQSHIDMAFSGSTIISCFMNHNKIYCCNVGDSRAILGRKDQKNKWSAVALSEDHKPSLPKEAERIKKMNGRVESYRDQYGQPLGPLRVWLKNQNIPGLAMTRSFGDLVGASVGVSPVPQIKQFTISKEDRIMIIASDGVFEFLQNQQIIQTVSEYYQKQQIQQASDHLLSLATKSWSKNSSIVDDITFILIFITYDQM